MHVELLGGFDLLRDLVLVVLDNCTLVDGLVNLLDPACVLQICEHGLLLLKAGFNHLIMSLCPRHDPLSPKRTLQRPKLFVSQSQQIIRCLDNLQ